MLENETKQTEEVKEPIIGEFKPKRKFLNFVSAVNGAKIRYIRDIAFLKGEKLSGQLEGVIFKVTICDEGTIKFEEVDTNVSDKGMIKRLIDDIDSMDVTGYAQKFVVAGLEFADKDGGRCYLEVEHKKPIDKLASLFEEEETKMEVSEKGLDILSQLFGSDDEMEIIASEKDAEVLVEAIETPAEPNEELKSASKNYLEEQFKRMNEEKIEELKKRIEDAQKDISKYDRDIKHAESKKKEVKENLGVLETRLESMYPGDEPNGYVFYISEEQKEETGLDESTRHVADKIADLMKLKKDVLFDYLTGGYYKIKIAKKDDMQNESLSIEREILEKLLSIDTDGKITMVENGNFEYRGELNWHQLVGKMIRKGFEQEPEFDKFCQSNSYFSKEEDKVEESCSHEDCECSDTDMDGYKNAIKDMAKGLGMKDVRFGEDGIELIPNDKDMDDEGEDEDGEVSVNDDYIFSIMVEPSASNDVGEPEAIIAITPKSFWDKNGYQYDQHIDHILRKKYPHLKSMGDKFEEVQEGGFDMLDSDNWQTAKHLSTKDTVENLCKAGVKFDKSFQDYISQKDTQTIENMIIQLGYSHLIY